MMILMLMVPPALVQPAPGAIRALESFVETLEALPEAVIDGEFPKLPALLKAARVKWEQARKAAAPLMPERELELSAQRLEAMGAMKPREQAEAALELCALVSGHLPLTPNVKLLNADRAGMLAWCYVDARRWEAVPNLAEAFRPLLEAPHGRHQKVVEELRASLERLRDDLAERSVHQSKRTLVHLLDLLDDLEKR
jgi:hypothetical protein